jgi:hypothetical protein
MTSQNIRDEFIYVSVQDNIKLKQIQMNSEAEQLTLPIFSFFSTIFIPEFFFSKSRFGTQPLYCVFLKKKIGWPANQTFFLVIQIFVLFCSRFFMYSSVGSILWEATVGRLAAGGVDGQG